MIAKKLQVISIFVGQLRLPVINLAVKLSKFSERPKSNHLWFVASSKVLSSFRVPNLNLSLSKSLYFTLSCREIPCFPPGPRISSPYGPLHDCTSRLRATVLRWSSTVVLVHTALWPGRPLLAKAIPPHPSLHVHFRIPKLFFLPIFTFHGRVSWWRHQFLSDTIFFGKPLSNPAPDTFASTICNFFGFHPSFCLLAVRVLTLHFAIPDLFVAAATFLRSPRLRGRLCPVDCFATAHC